MDGSGVAQLVVARFTSVAEPDQLWHKTQRVTEAVKELQVQYHLFNIYTTVYFCMG